MQTISNQRPINLKVVRFELDFVPPRAQTLKPKVAKSPKAIHLPELKTKKKLQVPTPPIKNTYQKRGVEDLIEELLDELYSDQRDWFGSRCDYGHRSSSTVGSLTSTTSICEQTEAIERSFLEGLEVAELRDMVEKCVRRMREESDRLARKLHARDRLRRQQKRLNGGLTVLIRHASGDISARFSVSPSSGGEGGFAQWLHAMRLVARLPSGVPQHFRKKVEPYNVSHSFLGTKSIVIVFRVMALYELWLTLADRHLTVQGIDWPTAERNCFRGTAHPEDTELGAQIVKDLHRTGCSLFCGAEGRENQAMLRRVLLAYARWNKEVGYCQGFNMLAAIILEVMEKSEADSLKVMIYLVEAVLPEGYFADDLRGLSADMAAFRDLLKIRLPRLAQHMDRLQCSSDGGGVEPPLPDVFTMQWFLTLYATWLPRGALLRIWDLVFLDGNEVLLLTALAIWDLLQDRILSARSADEYYSCMGGGAGAVWEAGDALVARVIALDAAPELPRLRDMHRYHVSPPVPPAAPPPSAPPAAPIHSTVQSVTRRGLKLFYSEDEGDSSDEGNKMALATVTTPRREEISGGDRLSLDIGALKRQYARLRERQRQAHVILAAACARHAAVGVSTTPTSLTVNHLLLGKSAIVSSRGRRLGPPPGAVPPSRRNVTFRTPRSNTHTDDTISWKEEHHRRNVTRRDSIKWKDIKKTKNNGNSARKSSLDDEEAGDGVIVSEREADEMMSSMRSRSMSESSSYSSRSGSSTDTSLCDDNNRASDFDSEPASIGDITAESFIQAGISNSTNKNDTQVESPVLEPKHLFQPVLREEIPLVKKKAMDIASLNIIEPPTITEYVTSTHGEQLRHYLEEFENRKNIEGSNLLSLLESPLHVTDTFKMSRDTSSKSESDIIGLRYSVEKDLTKTPEFNISSSSNAKSFVDISPAEFTASRYRVDYNSIYNDTCRLIDLLPDHSETLMYQSRPPDIIDSLTMSPNFVPDIDLSDKNLSDVDSPLRSPGAESIVVSEDEPPIPLKIDKYFEHSPEFFGARKVSGLRISDTEDIPNRRTPTRVSRLPRKPDSLMLQCNLNEKVQGKTEYESSQEICPSNFDVEIDVDRSRNLTNNLRGDYLILNEVRDIHGNNAISDIGKYKPMAKQYEKMGTIGTLESGRRNSEKALQIIQENSKILNRILTKQSAVTSHKETEDIELAARNSDLRNFKYLDNAIITAKIIESPVLKGSASDSLIKWDEPIKPSEFERNSEFSRLRPTSLDEPISPALVKKIAVTVSSSNFLKDSTQAAGKDADKNKTDLYGWENKGFLAKCNRNIDNNSRFETEPLSKVESPMYSTLSCIHPSESIQNPEYDWSVHKMDKKDITSDKSNVDFENISKFDPLRFQSKSVDPTTDPYDPSLTSKYSDCLLSRASDICSRMLDRGPKVCENISIADDSQASDFAFVVTSSVSFSYEPSADDDSPTAAKSNSSDTLCQITSLDQISTPISPKDTANIQKENLDKFDRSMISSDDTSSQITSLIDTETVSSLSCTRSPSSGSYHPFPARPAIRMPKELGVRLGLYSRDSINSPSK